jgi:uncharacterized protein (TIRG00374 family)
LPSIFLNIFDALGWRLLLIFRGHRVSWSMLVVNHIASEAIARSIPLGVPVADSVRSLLLKKEHAVPLPESVIASLARRVALGISQCIFVLVAIVLGYSDILAIFKRVPEYESTIANVVITTVTLCFISAAVLMVVRLKRDVLGLAPGLLQRFTFVRSFTTRLESLRLTLLGNNAVDAKQLPFALAFYSLIWVMEFAETYVLLTAMGFGPTVQQALAIEAGVSLMRLAAFFLPSGIGIQETGYAGIITTLGLGATSNIGMFLIIKRMRDILWIALGYAMLLGKGVIPSRKNISLELTKA